MKRPVTITVAIAVAIAALLALAALALPGAASAGEPLASKEALGKALFSDVNLSRNRGQACATCHDPDFAFTDPRATAAGRAVSLGDDGRSLGDRNTPTAAYALFSPDFHKTREGAYVGGQFLDGREINLEGQAGGPPLNPIEMGMADKAAVVARIEENAAYVSAFKALFGDKVFDKAEVAYAAMTQAIAAFERRPEFIPFSSKYDRYLRGEYQLTEQEELGRLLFFSQQFTNCNMCHQLHTSQVAEKETFTNYQYHNIGVPANAAARRLNGTRPGHVDHGLLDNPAVNDKAQDGKFKVPTLRNVAVTGPYMHNGIFKDLKTTVLFYNKYNSKSPKRQINPETGQTWAAPEVPDTLSVKELTHGPALDNKRIDALVAFMKALTDKRYEHLLEP